MAFYVDTIPQNIDPIKTVTIQELVYVLPEVIPFPLNFWIQGQMARFGRSSGNLTFIVEQPEEPSTSMKEYFNALVEPFGIQATVIEKWKDSRFGAIRLYNAGRLNIDKTTMEYTELPSPVYEAPVFYSDEIVRKLPKTIEWKGTLWLTGGLVKNGWSANDVDIITDNLKETFLPMKKFFSTILGTKVDIGSDIMAEREPVYLCPIYKDGICQL